MTQPTPYDVGTSLAGALIEHPQHGLLLQLRDEHAPTYPLHWSLFGGHMEGDEAPEVALWRELEEELQLTPALVHEWRLVQRTPRPYGGIVYIFHLVTHATPADLVLGEGKAMLYVAPDAMQPPAPYQGYNFTPNAARAIVEHLAGRDAMNGEAQP